MKSFFEILHGKVLHTWQIPFDDISSKAYVNLVNKCVCQFTNGTKFFRQKMKFSTFFIELSIGCIVAMRWHIKKNYSRNISLDFTYALQTLPELHGQISRLHAPKIKPKYYHLSTYSLHLLIMALNNSL